MKRNSSDEGVYELTSVPEPLSEDVARRRNQYLWAMALRTVCFVGAVIAPSPWRWIMIAGALFLPYVAVIVANGGREKVDTQDVLFVEVHNGYKALEERR